MAALEKSLKIAIKVRPLIEREKKMHLKEQWKLNGNLIHCIHDNKCQSHFIFGKFQANIILKIQNVF